MTLRLHIGAMDLERVVQLEREGRQIIFRMDRRPPLAFWRVECGDRVYLSPLRVSGDEQPEFFRSVAKLAVEVHGL